MSVSFRVFRFASFRFLLVGPHSPTSLLLSFSTQTDKTSTSFLIPQQGSLVIYNPPSSTASSSSSSSTLTSHLLHPPLTSHLQHLRRLLGIPSSTSILPGNTIFASQSSLGHPSSKITKWELSWLARARTLQNVKDSVGGVMGLERLVGKIGEMRVGKKVRDDVLGAVGELEEVSSCSFPVSFSKTGRTWKAPPLCSSGRLLADVSRFCFCDFRSSNLPLPHPSRSSLGRRVLSLFLRERSSTLRCWVFSTSWVPDSPTVSSPPL